MENFESRLDAVIVNGTTYDATSMTRTQKTLRQRVNTMGAQGVIKLKPEYGFTLVVPLKENPLSNPKLEEYETFVLTALHTNGTIEVFPGCVVLSTSESGNTSGSENSITYEAACDKPY